MSISIRRQSDLREACPAAPLETVYFSTTSISPPADAGIRPPDIEHPALAQTVPAGNPCPGCGVQRDSWIYNPFVKRSLKGWIKHTNSICRCSGSDPYAQFSPPLPPEPVYDQVWLDREFVQHGVRQQTLLTFHLAVQPRLQPVVEAVTHYARRFQYGRVAGRGVYLAGPSDTGKGHLVNALVNVARALGLPAVSLSPAQLLDLTVGERRDPPIEREARCRRRQALRVVPVLALRSLFTGPLLPGQLQELELLLEDREERGLITHVTAPLGPAMVVQRAGSDEELLRSIAHRLVRLTESPILAPPGVPPDTAEMVHAAERRGLEGTRS